ncbi:MAG TPA: hypothetical protein VLM88_00870, partial [Proteiniclasticum sp.]|nr:hypothetical protein [Proteiniclasticum sp.]
MRLRKSLKVRLAISYLIIIIVTLVITDFALASVLRTYFNNNVRDTLYNQLSVATDTYARYYADDTLEQNVANDEDAFWIQSNALVQIISTEGSVLLDSTGNRPQGVMESEDVRLALEGSRGSTIYYHPVTGE